MELSFFAVKMGQTHPNFNFHACGIINWLVIKLFIKERKNRENAQSKNQTKLKYILKFVDFSSQFHNFHPIL